MHAHTTHGKVVTLAMFAIVTIFGSSLLATRGLMGEVAGREELSAHAASVIGMSVGVPENEANRLAQALEQKASELSERERAIDAKEREVRAIVYEENSKQLRLIILLVTGVTFFLMTLIGVNFYMDRKRMLRETSERSAPSRHADPHAHAGEFTTKL